MKHGDALEPTLDPADWDNFRALAREMMDTTVDDLKGLPTRHAWRPLSDEDKSPFATPLPREGRGLRAAYQDFLKFVKPLSSISATPTKMCAKKPWLGWGKEKISAYSQHCYLL